MLSVLFVITTVLFAICYRGRGGAYLEFKSDSTQPFFYYVNSTLVVNFGATITARLFWWCIPTTILMYMCFGSFTLTSAAILSLFFLLQYITLVDPFSHGKYQNIRVCPDVNKFAIADLFLPNPLSILNYTLYNWCALTIVGFFRGLVLAIAGCMYSDWFLIVSLLYSLQGTAYLIGYSIPAIKLPGLSNGTTETGEFLTGLFCGFGVSIVMLINHLYPSNILYSWLFQ